MMRSELHPFRNLPIRQICESRARVPVWLSWLMVDAPPTSLECHAFVLPSGNHALDCRVFGLLAAILA